MYGYPVFKVGTIINKYEGKKLLQDQIFLVRKKVQIEFPVRLNIMVLDETKIAPNDQMIFPAGEVVVSINKRIKANVQFLGNYDGVIKHGCNTKRKAIVNHAYILMTHLLNESPSLYIDVDESEIPKHSGLGSTGAVYGAVCSAINELYDNPIDPLDLIQFITSNYGEEVADSDENMLQSMPAFGGSLTTGFYKGGIQIVAGHAVPIITINFNGHAVVGIPTDYIPGGASEEVEKHAKYLFEDAKKYIDARISDTDFSKNIAYQLLNNGIPNLVAGDITEITKIAFAINFDNLKYSANDFDWVYPRANEIAANLKNLYLQKKCVSVGKSSSGPAFYAIVSNPSDEETCVKYFEQEGMSVFVTDICNEKYKVI